MRMNNVVDFRRPASPTQSIAGSREAEAPVTDGTSGSSDSREASDSREDSRPAVEDAATRSSRYVLKCAFRSGHSNSIEFVEFNRLSDHQETPRSQIVLDEYV